MTVKEQKGLWLCGSKIGLWLKSNTVVYDCKETVVYSMYGKMLVCGCRVTQWSMTEV